MAAAAKSDMLEIKDYSDKAIAVFGESKPYKESLMGIGGKFNNSLKYDNDNRRPGYIFPKTKRSVVEKLLDDIKRGDVKKLETTPQYIKASTSHTTTSLSSSEFVERKSFLALLTRLEVLEQKVAMLEGPKQSSVSQTKQPTAQVEFDDCEEEDDEEEKQPSGRILKKK